MVPGCLQKANLSDDDDDDAEEDLKEADATTKTKKAAMTKHTTTKKTKAMKRGKYNKRHEYEHIAIKARFPFLLGSGCWPWGEDYRRRGSSSLVDYKATRQRVKASIKDTWS